MHMLAPPSLTRNPKLGPFAATQGFTGSTMNETTSAVARKNLLEYRWCLWSAMPTPV